MKVRSLLFSTLCVLAMSAALTACSSDNDQDDWSNDDNSLMELPCKRAFILNEGKSGANNAGIAFYAPNKDAKNSIYNFIEDIYKIQNKKGLGSTGMDIIEHNDYLYVTVYGSKLLLKLNKAGVEQKRLSFSEANGQPRYLVADGEKIYVSLYSGKVARIDAEKMIIEAYVDVNANPEQMTIKDRKLYVVNSGFGSGNTMSIIDLNTFERIKDVETVINPNYLLTANEEIYLISWGSWGDPVTSYSFQRVKADGTVEIIPAKATFFAEHNDIIYLVLSETDWNVQPPVTVNTYFTYNAKTHTLNNLSFLKDMPAALASTGVYAINVSDDGDIYITTSDYTTNGDVYRFSNNGTFIEKFDCGGMNPRKLIFVNSSCN